MEMIVIMIQEHTQVRESNKENMSVLFWEKMTMASELSSNLLNDKTQIQIMHSSNKLFRPRYFIQDIQ